MNNYVDTLKRIAHRYKLPDKLNYNTVVDFIKEHGSLESIWGLCNKDLSNIDLNELDEKTLMQIPFNEFTVFPKGCNVDYGKVMSKAKAVGLRMSMLHNNGINGKGVNVAIIDKPILKTHQEIVHRIKEYHLVSPKNEYNDKMHFHGITCAAFLCGNICGVANNSNLYYYAYPDWFEDDGMYWSYHFKALDMIIEHNRNSNEAIRVVSISAGFPRNREDLHNKMSYYISELKKYNCQIIYSNNFVESFTCSSKKFGYSSDDVNCYCLDTWQTNEWDKQKILIPSGGRSSPCNSGEDKYMYCGNQSCYSWAIPYLCGVYVLALQCDSTLSYDDFVIIANEAKTVNDGGLFILNPLEIIDRIQMV